jgi:hypothetical protein
MTPKPIASLIFALVVALPLYALAESDDEVPPSPDRNPARVQGAVANEPVAQAPVLPGDQPTVPWTDEEIAAAKAECSKALANLVLDYEPLPPIKEGICGAPAPILLKSIGSDPKVVIDPPATVTCPLARGLSAWLSKTVQPEAKAVLGSQVVKLHNATSYACRNRYGSATTPLSEHALANALDVSEFFLASGEHITVLDGWPRLATVPPPPTHVASPSRVASVASSIMKVSQAATPTSLPVIARDSAIVVTRIKANPFEVPAPPQEAKSPSAPAPTSESTVAKTRSNPFVAPAPAQASTPQSATPQAATPQDATPSGAVPQDAEPEQTLAEREGVFVKTVHDDACNTFGTVLGPEANEAHKNHFHLDMKARRRTAFCE